jgi:parallel beta-helix repeat protein
MSLYSSELLNISSNAVGDVRTSAFVKFTHNSSILDNVIQNGDNGIFLESSNGNDISNNYISAMRSNAVYVIYSWNNIFTSNEIVDNDGVGVYLYDSANCAVYANYIGYNLRGNAYDFVGPATKSHSNKWDDGFGLGNVWGGISTLNPYTVAGDRGSLDRYPIPILTTGNPSDFTVEAGSTSAILWNASAARPHYYQVEQDGIILEEGAWDGKPIDVDIISLDPGIYNYTLLINTTDGREMSHSMQVFSVDTTHPVWILPPVNRAIEHGTRLAMMIEASDLYGISKYWVNDTTRFSIDEEGNLEDTDALPLGTHPLEVRAYDPSLNYISAEIVITVQDTIAPEISGPEDIAYDEGDTGNAISWTISDRNPLSYQVYRNGELVALSPGTYVYRLELFDLAGNSVADEVTVMVNPKTTEPPSETPPTQITETTSTSPSTSPQIPTEPTPANGTMLITGIAGIVMLGVAAAVLMMKRKQPS